MDAAAAPPGEVNGTHSSAAAAAPFLSTGPLAEFVKGVQQQESELRQSKQLIEQQQHTIQELTARVHAAEQERDAALAELKTRGTLQRARLQLIQALTRDFDEAQVTKEEHKHKAELFREHSPSEPTPDTRCIACNEDKSNKHFARDSHVCFACMRVEKQTPLPPTTTTTTSAVLSPEEDSDDNDLSFLKPVGKRCAPYAFPPSQFTLEKVDITPDAVHSFLKGANWDSTPSENDRAAIKVPSRLPVFTRLLSGDCDVCHRTELSRGLTFPTRCSKHTLCDTCGAMYLYFAGERDVHADGRFTLPCVGHKLKWFGSNKCVVPEKKASADAAHEDFDTDSELHEGSDPEPAVATTLQCTNCKRSLPKDMFAWGKGKKRARLGVCITCQNGEESVVCGVCKRETFTDANPVLLCAACESVCHLKCTHPPLSAVPKGSWYCEECSVD